MGIAVSQTTKIGTIPTSLPDRVIHGENNGTPQTKRARTCPLERRLSPWFIMDAVVSLPIHWSRVQILEGHHFFNSLRPRAGGG